MATDPNKKTLRHFQCRDYLWETFEQMSAELECSVDYLINEAMRQYSRSRNQGVRAGTTGAVSAPPPGRDSHSPLPSAPTLPPTRPLAPSPAARPATAPQISVRPPAIPSVPAAPGASSLRIPSLTGGAPIRTGTPNAPMARPMAPHIPPLSRPPAPPVPRPSVAPPPMPSAAVGQAMRIPPLATSAAPPPPQRAPAEAPVASGSVLYAVYQGERYPVMKEEFVIGRGNKTSDLVIKDSNVSRRHAVVVLHNGQYWIVDQQSTNGVEFLGAKIDRKRIEEGDVFRICDYEIAFTYR